MGPTSDTGPRRLGFRLALGASAALGAGTAGAWSYAQSGAGSGDLARDLAVGWAYAGAGLVAWWRRPGNRTGPLMVAEGVTWFIGNLQGTSVPALFAVGAWWEGLNLAVLVHLVLTFPDGRITGARTRGLIHATYATVAVGGLLRALTYDPARAPDATYLDCRDCGPNALLIDSATGLFEPVDLAYRGLALVISALTVTAVVHRWRRASLARRRALLPVWVAIAVALVFVLWDVVLLAAPGIDGLGEDLVLLLSDLAQCAVPLAFLAGLLRMRLQHAEVGGLVIEVGADPTPARMREVLARVLGDSSLRLGLWQQGHGVPGRYVDEDGGPVRADGARATRVDSARGTPLAVLDHDPALAEDPELLAAVGAALRLGLENAWLRTEAREAGTRLVRAADDERRRLERDLHDGAQARIVFALMALRRVGKGVADHPDAKVRGAVAEVEQSLRLALEELRGLAHGIHPAVLTREGLAPALAELALQAELPVVVAAEPGRYDPVVETTAYFTVCETLANAAKHARARAVSVSARRQGGTLVVETVDDGVGGADTSRGSGLSGLADRIAAVDGVLSVHSPAGGGTRVRAELPCA
ncbi:sensor histidine kinase [Streptomyces cavernicola]|uniref:histidine kinase n=1 Tax=Streptomyces cavernicola TaxID=3043613 RepID=A0ABT6S790_9ACTN|nr:histidine kinase [Streptomyces sp. B-S-A6]MDI3403970.1 histidine kinase [Streptomyces sp. B-S-A6]